MVTKIKIKELKRVARHERIRWKISGRPDRPRLCIHRSLKNLYVQLIDDLNGKVLFGFSTLNKDLRNKIKSGGNVEAASILGEAVAKEVMSRGIKNVCFDRGGYLYHGRIKAFAEAARKGGLEF